MEMQGNPGVTLSQRMRYLWEDAKGLEQGALHGGGLVVNIGIVF
jgi:hypothetical protein